MTTIGHSKLDQSLPQLPAVARAKLASALGSGAAPNGHVSPHVVHALHHAFVSALAGHRSERNDVVVAFGERLGERSRRLRTLKVDLGVCLAEGLLL